MLDCILADDVLLGVSEMLSPQERCRLSSCNRHFRRLLPHPLRIRIVTWTQSSCLCGDLFVSPVEDPNKMLLEHEPIYTNQRYYFWKYDEEEQARVYLGRHLRQTLKEGNPTKYRYTLGLRPKYPNQSWKITRRSNNNNADDRIVEIPWEAGAVQLSVCGIDRRSGQPDSNEEQVLSAKTSTIGHAMNGTTWHVADPKGTTEEFFQIVRSAPSPRVRTHTPIHRLEVYSIPDICDKGAYLYYSPQQWKRRLPTDGRCAIIEFSHWIEKGYLFFRAKLLPFALAIPIMKLDRSFFVPELNPVAE